MLKAFSTSVGKKAIVAVTGLGLFLFVFGHMVGNLQFFLGRDTLNRYAEFLHSVPELLWVVRLGLLAFIVLHIAVTVKLWAENQAARPTRYVYQNYQRATLGSRYMILSGLTVLAFIVYHLLHFTVRVVPDDYAYLYEDKIDGIPVVLSRESPLPGHGPATKVVVRAATPSPSLADDATESQAAAEMTVSSRNLRHDCYGMVLAGFSQPPVVAFYLLAQVLLAFHLSHGASSMFQTLGWNSPRYRPLVSRIGPVMATIICLGFISVPIAIQIDVWTGVFGFAAG